MKEKKEINKIKEILPGFIVCVIIGLIAQQIAKFFPSIGAALFAIDVYKRQVYGSEVLGEVKNVESGQTAQLTLNNLANQTLGWYAEITDENGGCLLYTSHVLVKIHRFKTVISIVLFVGFFGLYMYAVNYLQTYLVWLIENGKSIAEAIEKAVFPLYHLSIALTQGNICLLYTSRCV